MDALDLRVAAAVRLLGPCDFSKEAHELSESATGKKVRFLGKLEVVFRELTPCLIDRGRIDACHLDVERQWNLSRDVARIDGFGPHSLVGLRSDADGFHLDLIFCLFGQVVTIETEGFTKRIELRKADMTRLAGGLIFARERRDGICRMDIKEQEH